MHAFFSPSFYARDLYAYPPLMADWTTTLITGANRGLGLEFTRQLKAEPYEHRIIATARNPADASELQELLTNDDLLLPLDVSMQASADRLAEEINNAGVEPGDLDVLINNAGIGGKGAPIAETDTDNILHVLNVNAVGPMRVVQAMIPFLRAGEAGTDGATIVNVSSQLGSIHNNTGGSSYAYRSSKAALNMLNKHLAIKFEPKRITPIAIHPGWVQTDMGGPDAHLSPTESVAQIISNIIVPANHATHAGTFRNFDGSELPW